MCGRYVCRAAGAAGDRQAAVDVEHAHIERRPAGGGRYGQDRERVCCRSEPSEGEFTDGGSAPTTVLLETVRERHPECAFRLLLRRWFFSYFRDWSAMMVESDGWVGELPGAVTRYGVLFSHSPERRLSREAAADHGRGLQFCANRPILREP
jgi:hypothetical protein